MNKGKVVSAALNCAMVVAVGLVLLRAGAPYRAKIKAGNATPQDLKKIKMLNLGAACGILGGLLILVIQLFEAAM